MASNDTRSGSAPPLTIAVHLKTPPFVVVSGVPVPDLERVLAESLADLFLALGIPGRPLVAIAALDGAMAADRFLRMFVNEDECGYPDELLRSVYAYTKGAHVDASMPLQAMLDALADPACDSSFSRNTGEMIEFVARACVEVVLANRSMLLGAAQLASYVESLQPPEDVHAEPWDTSWAGTVLHAVIDQGLSIADRRTITALLTETIGKSAPDAAEHLVAALAPPILEIQLPSDYLRELTTALAHDTADLFPFLRAGLFNELGVKYPPFRFVPMEELKPRCIAFKFGAISTLPIVGLAPDQLLVNDTSDRLRRMDIEATPAINPATSHPACLIDAQFRHQARTAGLTTWDNAEHVVLSLAAALRRNSRTFVHRRTVQPQLDVIAHVFPGLVQQVTMLYSVERITGILRFVVAEEVPIRNLRIILERLVDASEAVREPSGEAADEQRQTDAAVDLRRRAELVAFVRQGLCYEIKNQCARSTDTVVVYLLDPALERLFGDEASPRETADVVLSVAQQAAVRKAIHNELAMLPRTAQLPAVLTSGSVRAGLHRAIAAEFPRLRVIAYEELPPETNIQPVARIAVAEAVG